MIETEPTRELAAMLAMSGRVTSALKVYEQLLGSDADDAESWLQKGLLHQDRSDFVLAQQALERARVIAPGNAWSHFHLGLIAASLGRDLAAVEHFRAAHTLEPDNGEFKINLANGLFVLGRWEAAAAIVEPMGDALPGWWGSLRDIAIRALANGRARVHELVALRNSTGVPLERSLALELADLSINVGLVPLALRICERLLGEDGADLPALRLQAKATAQSEGISAALATLDLARDGFGGQPDYEMAVAQLCFEANDLERALGHAAKGKEADRRAYGRILLAARLWPDLFSLCRNWMTETDDTVPFAMLLRALAGLDRLFLFCDDMHGEPRIGTIPPLIVQFWDSETVPDDVATAIATWRDQNRGFEHRLFNEATARAFIENSHGQRALAAFDRCHHPAMKADFFRVAYLVSEGGLYVDADDVCARPVAELLEAISGAGFAASLSGDVAPYVHNWFLAAAPGSPVLKLALADMINGIDRAHALGIKADIWHTTGPGLITRSAARWLSENPESGGEAVFLTTRQYRGFVKSIEDLEYKKTAAGNWRRTKPVRDDIIAPSDDGSSSSSPIPVRSKGTQSMHNTPSQMLAFIEQFMNLEWDPGMGECLPIYRELNAIVAQVGEPLEGSLFHQTRAPLQDLPFADYRAKRRNFTAFCGGGEALLEIGFNAGHSALLALLANPSLRYTGVDLGEHRYTQPCFDLLKSRFGDRVELLIGDSRDVLPVLRRTGRSFDLYHVDGGHGFDVAHSDICNVLDFCKSGGALLVDDTDNPLIDALCDMLVMQGAMARLHPHRLWSEQIGGWHALFRVAGGTVA